MLGNFRRCVISGGKKEQNTAGRRLVCARCRQEAIVPHGQNKTSGADVLVLPPLSSSRVGAQGLGCLQVSGVSVPKDGT